MNNDSQALELLKEIDRKQDRLIERLFGDLDNENPAARFPRLEAAQQDVDERVQSLETDRIRLHTLTAVISSIIGFLVSLFVHPFRN